MPVIHDVTEPSWRMDKPIAPDWSVKSNNISVALMKVVCDMRRLGGVEDQETISITNEILGAENKFKTMLCVRANKQLGTKPAPPDSSDIR